MITLYAFKWVPDFAQGLVRDLLVRWAPEEAGLRYGTKLLGQNDKDLRCRLHHWRRLPSSR